MNATTFWFGTEFASKSPEEQHALLWGDEEDSRDKDDKSGEVEATGSFDGEGSLLFQQGKLILYNGRKQVMMMLSATSGEPGVTDPRIPWLGPIPPGRYTLYPGEISKAGLFRTYMPSWIAGDWGRYRVRLHPDEGTDTYGRRNLFLHGGKVPGTRGCIDVGNADKDLFSLLMRMKGPISLEVR